MDQETEKTITKTIVAFTDRASLAINVYEEFLEHSDSFRIPYIESNLVYLLGAILKDEKFECGAQEWEFEKFLDDVFPPDHGIWEYIQYDGPMSEQDLHEALAAAGVHVREQEMFYWTRLQRLQAEAWLNALDDLDIQMPKKPDFLP